MKRVSSLAILSVCAVFCHAQSEISGPKQFPQFRSFSGLPGGGFGVGRDGVPRFNGAFALSTPIAFSVNGWAAGIGNMSDSMRLSFFERGREHQNQSNGSAYLMGGEDVGFGTLSSGWLVLSSIFDNVMNFQFTPKLRQEKFEVAIGVQDALNTGGEAGEPIDNKTGGGNSRSFYGVATLEAGSDVFLSLGTGTRRFEGVFANASFPVMRRVRGMVEYDAFNWNVGLLGEVARFQTRGGYEPQFASASMFLGVVRGKFLTWGLSVGF